MSTTVVSIAMPNQQLQVDATVQRSPLVVLDQSVVSNPPAAKGLQPEALSDVWWSFRFRHVGHARLGYGSLPPAPLAEIAAGAAPYLLDPEGALDLSFDSRFDAKGHRFLGGLFLAWIEDRSAFPASQLDVTPLEPPGSRIQVPVQELTGYRSAVSDVPLSTALRWAFLTDAQLDTLLPGRDQGVLFVSTTDGRVVAAMRWDKPAGRVVSLDVIVPPEPVEGDLEPFSSVWWGGISNAANFPSKTENNEQYIGSAPMPHDAQEIVRSVDFKRELFLDGPGWLLSGAPSLKSLVVDLLDPRGQDQAGDPFPATVTVDGTALTAGQGFGTTTVVSYSDIRQGTLSQVALRLLWIPAHVLAS